MITLQEKHKLQVSEISEQVKDFYKQKKKVRIYHGSTNSTRTQKFQKNAFVNTSNLNHIISINFSEKYAIVEPNVSMDRLVKETMKFGLVPPVVMEFPGITVGGGIQGGAGESSSFKYGGFHHTCLEYEIILGNGNVVKASREENADLYWGTACSYGSLGVITQVKIKLIPARKYVLLRYNRISSFSEAIKKLESAVKTNIDFIDAILFSREQGTIMTGMLTDEKKRFLITKFSKAKDDWFYTHTENVTKKCNIWEEIIPLEDYLFRYNRGAFWVGRYAFQRLKLPFNRVTRFLLNPLMKTRTLYRFLQAINISQRQIVQDLCLPKETTLQFLEFIDKTTNIYPLWLLPGKLAIKDDKLSPGYLKTTLSIDVGVWGKVKGDYAQMVALNRNIEKTLTKLGGRKVLYAHQYYPKEEFWKIYDEKWYRNLRKKYHAEVTLPDVYEKTYVKEEYEISVLKGLWQVIKSPFKLPISY
ncbi:MAG TPA: FAD-binding protein [Candidatus Saccharimonadales bacterium]|nr:FAD-binding protein [Candidatus Saccharimonadales bacterium]